METITINLDGDIGFEFFCRLRHHDDQISIALKGHLLAEYMLDRFVREKTQRNPIRLTFSRKFELLSQVGILPEHLVVNLQRLNTYRNRLAHELDSSIVQQERVIRNARGIDVKLRSHGRRYPERYYLKMLVHVCLTDLHNQMVYMNLDPRFGRDITANKRVEPTR